MLELQVRKLTLEQAEEIYKKHLKEDFPPAELKPFLVIRKAWMKNNYYAYGFYEKASETLCAYAFFLADHKKRALLLDYFAVSRELRGSGYGSRALEMLRRECADWDTIIIEVEDDELPGLDEETRRLRKRRIAFYTEAGCRMTTTRSRLWGVDYRIMVIPLQDNQAEKNTAEKICSLYQGMYDKSILKMRFQITEDPDIPQQAGGVSNS